jgi:hypothetical protein
VIEADLDDETSLRSAFAYVVPISGMELDPALQTLDSWLARHKSRTPRY